MTGRKVLPGPPPKLPQKAQEKETIRERILGLEEEIRDEYWRRFREHGSKGYNNTQAQIDESIALGKLAEALQSLLKARAAYEQGRVK